MCRIVGYVGNSEAELQALFQAFRQGSSCDPYLKKAGIHFSAHKDGWGYVLLDSNGLHHYRTARAVYEDDTPLPRLTGKIHAILHSRLGSDQTLNGHICAHPFAGSNDRASIFFAHNGGVDCDTLPPRMVDSEWAFAQVLKLGSLENALPLLMEKTKANAALNLLVLTIARDPAQPPALQYLNFYKSTEPGRIGYYQMFTGDMPAGKAVVSSTIKDLHVKGLTNVAPALTGKLQTL
jgi:glutamine amidotransferase